MLYLWLNLVACVKFIAGQDHQEDHFASGVQRVQDQEAALHQENQAL